MQSAGTAREQAINEYNQLLRRLRQYTTQDEWAALLVEAAGRVAETVALFALKDSTLILLAARNLSVAAGYAFDSASAAAFSSAVEARDSVVALRTPNEVGGALAYNERGSRAHLLPVLNGLRVVAVLFAADCDCDIDALELIAGMASVVLERQSNTLQFSEIGNAPPQAGPRKTLPAATRLRQERHPAHVRARRFSRVKVAEMQLAKPAACRSGCEQGDLYLYLKPEIDAARDLFRKQFAATPSMVDYLHLELVRAADGDELKLGDEYPGPLL